MQIFLFLKIISLFVGRFFFFLNTILMASHKFAARLRVIGLPGHPLTEMQEGQ